MNNKKREFFVAVIIAIAVIIILVGASILFHQMVEVGKEEPMAVTIMRIERAEVRFIGGFFATDRVESMPYIIAETENGETIRGIIDISTLDKGDEIVIIENTPGQSQEFKEYKWYKFVGYQ